MALDVASLSIQEIKQRWLESERPVSAQVLRKLMRDPRRGVRQVYEQLRKRQERAREEALRMDAMLHFEQVLWRSGVQRIAGVDEAGMGPLAGPVVAAAVVFPPGSRIDGVDDSKKLDAETRERLDVAIREVADVGVGVGTVDEIDTLNIYQAALLAMRRAVEALSSPPEHVLVDARTIPGLAVPQNKFDRGDGLDFSIAAASIVAKTWRDRHMLEVHAAFPAYGFSRHKGYATPEHQEAIRVHGPCPLHRRSYQYIDELCGGFSGTFYDLMGRLSEVSDAADLRAVDAAIAEALPTLPEPEQRKLKLTLNRRWNTVAG